MRSDLQVALSAFTLVACAALADPCEPIRIAPPSVVPPTNFGAPVAVDGDYWFIGDINARVLCPGDPFSCSAGAVHVYEMAGGVLEHRQMLTSPMPRLGDFYGRTIDAENGRVAIGSLNAPWPGLEATGGAFIYEFDGERWVQTGSLRPPEGVDPLLSTLLGGIVSLEGDSAYLRPFNKEIVFRYTLRSGVWEYEEMIRAPDGEPTGSLFGVPILTQGEWAFICASDDSSLVHRGGSVYAYRREPDGSLTFVQKIVPTDAPGGAEVTQLFGFDASFDGRTLAVGAVGARRPDSSNGAVLLYELVDGAWTFQQEVTHPEAEAGDGLGFPVKVYDDILLATAGDQGSPTTGSVLHLFRRGIDGQWRYTQQLVPNVPFFARNFAARITTDGRYVLASSGDDSDGSGSGPGAAYQFDLACTGCQPDLDLDGALTIFDFLAFFNAFDAGDPVADFDGDGALTIFDFLAFQTAFDAGCA